MNWRVPLGFLVAPVLPCTVFVAPAMIARPEWTGAWLFIAYMVIVSLVISWVVAVPAYLLLRAYWRVGFMQCLLSGATIGVFVTLATALVSMGSNFSASDSGGPTVINGHYTVHGWLQNFQSAGYMALLGAGIGFVFWAVAIWSPRATRAKKA